MSSLKLVGLGRAVGGLDYAAVSVAVKRFERRIAREKKLANMLKDATAKLWKC